MKNIVKKKGETLVVTLEDVSKLSDVDLLSIQKLIRQHNDRFNIELTKGSYKDLKSLCLTEREAYHLITYMKNTEKVKNFKDSLIEQFFLMREKVCEINKKQLDLKDNQIKKLSSKVYAKRREGNLQTVTRIIKDNQLQTDPHNLNILLVSKGLLKVEDKVVEFFSNDHMHNNTPLLHTDTVLKICDEYDIERGFNPVYQQRFDFGDD
jgi:phage regulator Rha-like protein